MTSKLFEKVRAAFECVQQMKIADRAAASMGVSVLGRQYDGRPIKPFRYARCGKTNDSSMPILSRNDDKVLPVNILRFKDRQLRDLLLHQLTLAIAAVEKLSETARFLCI